MENNIENIRMGNALYKYNELTYDFSPIYSREDVSFQKLQSELNIKTFSNEYAYSKGRIDLETLRQSNVKYLYLSDTAEVYNSTLSGHTILVDNSKVTNSLVMSTSFRKNITRSQVHSSHVLNTILVGVECYDTKFHLSEIADCKISKSNLDRSTATDSRLGYITMNESYVRECEILNGMSLTSSDLTNVRIDNSSKYSDDFTLLSYGTTMRNCVLIGRVRLGDSYIKNWDMTKLLTEDPDGDRPELKKNILYQTGLVPDSKGNYKVYKTVLDTYFDYSLKKDISEEGIYFSDHSKEFKYRLGTIAKAKNPDEDIRVSCSAGLHCSNPLYWHVANGVVLECSVNIKDIITCMDGKIRTRKLKPIREVHRFE